MKYLGTRHFGIRVKDTEKSRRFYEKLGFEAYDITTVTIHGRQVTCIKMVDCRANHIELLDGGMPHIAIEVEEVNRKHYYFTTPDGYKVQYIQDPDGNCIELVEKPKDASKNKLEK